MTVHPETMVGVPWWLWDQCSLGSSIACSLFMYHNCSLFEHKLHQETIWIR